jgi:hypothetical protein
MQKRIWKHLTKHDILNNEQHGFRIGLNTDNTIYQLTNKNLNAMNNKLPVGGIFCDLEKTFDCVDLDTTLSIEILRNQWQESCIFSFLSG